MKATYSKVPKHLGVILDGNRRFAKRLMLKPWKGHEWGYKKVEKLLEWCREFEIKEVTLYAFSIENFDRPKKEFDYLMKLFKEAFTKLKAEKEKRKGVKINFIGRIKMFPKDLQKVMYELMQITKDNKKYIINFAMAYGGRAEIIDAVKKIALRVKKGELKIGQLNEKVFEKNLYIQSAPDLIIRTSEQRISGFLLWQSAYSELIFLPNKLWPEFNKKDFTKCIAEYSNRERRFGE
ncbi:MAG TPA: polyprenyl diphosphate synthase [Candidatus Nanoarchaeia archaeon]|nr:polyprenyl diphosphate synthase [Candidatus Nanoarchaeia archaeon]